MPENNLPPGPPVVVPAHRTIDWNWWTDFVSAALLGLAAVAAGWAAYQSSLWNSDSIFSLNDANEISRNAAALESKSLQQESVDVGVFLQYIHGLISRDKKLAAFIYQRVRPEMKPALEAWLSTRPLTNPNAPPTPFAMEQYRLSARAEAERLSQVYAAYLRKARAADLLSDRYVLMTIPFAIVSLLSGLSTRFASAGVRLGLVALALAVFLFGAIQLGIMPRA
ncbi:MAG: hypothetical protein ACM3ZB_12555 [bacterium]